MPGSSAVRALEAGGGLWAIVSTVRASDYDEAALARGLQDLDWVGERAVAHEAVVEHFLGAAAVLPMQLFTLFTSDERSLDHVARDRARIDRIVARIEHQLEWGLRLSFDEQAARASVEANAKRGRSRDADENGTSYLASKRDLLNVSRVQLKEASVEADRLYRAVAREATDARRRTATEQGMPGSRLLLDAAFLVPRQRTRAFKAAVRHHARTLTEPAIVLSMTGPWPPYNFIDSSGARRSAPSKRAAQRTRAPRSGSRSARPTARTSAARTRR